METSPWEIRVLTEGARGEMDETPATIAVEAEETVNLLAGSEATTKAKTSTLTGQDREVPKNRVLVVYEGAVPPPPQTKKATVDSDSQRTQRTQAAAGTVAAALVTTTDVGVKLALTDGRMTAQTTIVLEELQAEADGKRTPSSWTPRPWAITTGRMQLM